MTIETVLQLLENQKWHNIKDISKEAKLNVSLVENITRFLEKYNFVKINETTQKVKLNPTTSKFLKKIRQLETEETQ
jgi:predicted transcriptional regulator